MDDFVGYLLVALIIVALVFLGISVAHDTNLSGDANASYTGTYCASSGCDTGQVTHSSYIYPDEPFTCPETTSVFMYFLPVGKVLVPQYTTYYLLNGSCQITPL